MDRAAIEALHSTLGSMLDAVKEAEAKMEEAKTKTATVEEEQKRLLRERAQVKQIKSIQRDVAKVLAHMTTHAERLASLAGTHNPVARLDPEILEMIRQARSEPEESLTFEPADVDAIRQQVAIVKAEVEGILPAVIDG